MTNKLEHDYPIPVPPDQFDQKNEVFKRARWDQEIISWARPFLENVKYENRTGYRRHDYALRMGAWNLEHDMACGNSQSNSKLYSWSCVSEKVRPYIETGDRMDCTTCVSVCPFNKSRGILHDSVRTVIRTVPVLNRMIAKTDDLLEYGKPKHSKEFWNASP
jgi:hypothetical protein